MSKYLPPEKIPKNVLPIILCIPHSICPVDPGGNDYKLGKCYDCHNDMWIGRRTRALRKKQKAHLMCMACALDQGLAKDGADIQFNLGGV